MVILYQAINIMVVQNLIIGGYAEKGDWLYPVYKYGQKPFNSRKACIVCSRCDFGECYVWAKCVQLNIAIKEFVGNTTYSKGTTKLDTVESANLNKYPINGKEGDRWYVKK